MSCDNYVIISLSLSLSRVQACDGTIAKLRQALFDINRSDAVNIIDRYMHEERGIVFSVTAVYMYLFILSSC